MTSAPRLRLALFCLAALVCPACKKNKPPARTRVWLGPAHACALQKAGTLECWGANASGQLGDATRVGRLRPGAVVVSTAPRELALGVDHTCALFATDQAGDEVRCWGSNARGQLGMSVSATSALDAQAVTYHDRTLRGVTGIAAFGTRTCALTPEGVVCWGDGDPAPREQGGLRGRAHLVAVGEHHVCAALAEPPMVRCAGQDERGQTADHKDILVGAAVVSLTAGASHTCASLSDGSVQCWGANDAGQLGDGTTTDSRVPAMVHGVPPSTRVAAGSGHTCALLRSRGVACWGRNDSYQLANGTTLSTAKPGPIAGLVGALELVVSGDSACVRLDGFAVRCWGGNDVGQLGDGTTAPHEVPMPVKASELRP